MTPDLRLRLLKTLVNVPLRVVDKLLPEPQSAVFPQTKLQLRTCERLLKAYRLDCGQGTFGARPDGNFERFLRVSKKILTRISEDDRYYRAWVGLAFLVAHKEVNELDFSADELKGLCRRQWQFDVDFLSDAHVSANKTEFVEMALCDYLGNLADLQEEDYR